MNVKYKVKYLSVKQRLKNVLFTTKPGSSLHIKAVVAAKSDLCCKFPPISTLFVAGCRGGAMTIWRPSTKP